MGDTKPQCSVILVTEPYNCIVYLMLTCTFHSRIGNGSFATDGVDTDSNNTVNGSTSVHCLSNHTTSFAVLVDVGGGLQVDYLEGKVKINTQWLIPRS